MRTNYPGPAGCATPMMSAPKGVDPDDLFATGIKLGVGKFTKTFKTPGKVYYICALQCVAGMYGSIDVVQ
ncbi:uncharacterized protein VTP21DRAFT_5302 [Calcarisporiella thermophila]|uniref:uncharacterized protein n=1 Tax=Calcarisporiella thermophila TaxID=911321 RepID=UPI00374413A3